MNEMEKVELSKGGDLGQNSRFGLGQIFFFKKKNHQKKNYTNSDYGRNICPPLNVLA